jgi:predicted alpha/beta-fold hydrolase
VTSCSRKALVDTKLWSVGCSLGGLCPYSGYKLINISAVKFILAAKVDKPSLGKEGFPSVKETQNAN